MPVIKLIDQRARIVTKWNGEPKPRHGNVGDTASFPSVPAHWVSAGAVEIVSEEEPKREFIVNPSPMKQSRKGRKAKRHEATSE